MVKVVIDTSVLIEKIRMKEGVFDHFIGGSDDKKCELGISAITLTELWMGGSMNYKHSVDFVEDILKPIQIMTVDGNVAKIAGKLIRNREVDGFDALIAATCIKYDAELVTLNVKHFKNVKGLKLYNENL